MDVEEGSPPPARRWQGGRPETLERFEHLVEVFQDRMVRYAFRRLGNLHEAEEAAQEVFVRAYFDQANSRTTVCVSAYLYRIAANLCTDLLRKRRRPTVALEHVDAGAMAANSPTGPQALARAEQQDRVEQLLARLPRRQAEVIRLRVFDELRMAEIAEVLGCPVATAKSRLRYGLTKLRKILPPQWETIS
ncbi:MAG TPA: sigma-70 family RNA polymerase sigma factor [Phycisphaerae bacterium]|nr:sigma-70 family RNA polymerase sigma factor [Phycisphaerae bacterium]